MVRYFEWYEVDDQLTCVKLLVVVGENFRQTNLAPLTLLRLQTLSDFCMLIAAQV